MERVVTMGGNVPGPGPDPARTRPGRDPDGARTGPATGRAAILSAVTGSRTLARRATVPLAIGGAALLLAACSTGGPKAAPPTTAPAPGTATTAPRSATAPAPTTTTTLGPITGPLQLDTPVPVPVSGFEIAATEGPDGAVFVSAKDPASAAPAVVWVVDGNGPAAVAEHVSQGVAALAADATTLYVATYATVTAYNRSTGNQSGQWTLPAITTANSSDDDLVSLAAGGGNILVSITQGDTVSAYRINPGSPAAPALVAQGSSVAIGPGGSVYFARSDNHLVQMTGGGSVVVGPALLDAPNGEGGGVQYVSAVAGGSVWVTEPAGQGLDAQVSTFDASTLQAVATFGGTANEQFVDTVAGVLMTGQPATAPACPQDSASSVVSCVYRISASGVATGPLAVGQSVALLGPDPAVIESNPPYAQLDVVRIS
jgi:hypothetical protein